ncbi:dATP/dGTP pyrophosphohydrolase domain-containing protein [Xanthomonas arboricola]|uniref:dATP/dGTP pyrophosphohydrolase domain-containing protein n=1 Tax=Xanthomonas arboricola TaxID=56448 RepID=UPI0019D06A6D|nr:dATP/dGTP pyrophosphohydrolase domain-containing protein [Xanthomonas arboricola]
MKEIFGKQPEALGFNELSGNSGQLQQPGAAAGLNEPFGDSEQFAQSDATSCADSPCPAMSGDDFDIMVESEASEYGEMLEDGGPSNGWSFSCEALVDFSRAIINAWGMECRAHKTALAARQPVGFDFMAHLQRQRAWSERTFGPGDRAAGVVDHIRKELREIESDPGDLAEWIDVAILALDGAWRSGASAEQIIAALVAKQTRNEGRTWPDWRTADPNKAIEHDRSGEVPPAPAAVPVDGLRDAERIDAIAREYWRLDPIEIPTGAGDADVGWRVSQFLMPNRIQFVAEVFVDDPRQAIDAAMLATHPQPAAAGGDA